MKVKRFFAPDMRQAMQRVREEIGADAVIVSNHRVAGGVEVVAAHEHEYEAAQEEFKRKRAIEKRKQADARRLSDEDKVHSNLAEELRKAQARIATAQVGGEPSRDKNRQLDNDDAELSDILDTLKQRQRGRTQQTVRNADSRPVVDNRHSDPGSSLLKRQGEAATNIESDQRFQPKLDPTRFESPPGGAVDSAAGSQGFEHEQQVISSMQEEIASLKAVLKQQAAAQENVPEPVIPVSPVSQSNVAESVPDRVERRLERIGLGQQLSQQLTGDLADRAGLDDAWRSTLTRLSDVIPVSGEDFIERGGMIAFVGPTGVGKTTTIGKLAARYVLKHGSSSVALVTTDSYRIAAHEQLLTFGRILDVPVRVVDENNPLEEVLNSLRSKRLVLIDTAGMNAHEPHTQAQLDMLLDVPLRLKKLLVLSCSSQRHVIESAYQTYTALGLNGCVLSKLDESGNLGEAIDLIVENGLPVTYVTDGQRVPDDIDVAHKRDLVSRAVVTAQKASRSHRLFNEQQRERLSHDEQWEN
ncbi:flagellar biosynthesis protein FlhF [Amphritea sp. HPY]|uniref:flagellar biosynthesis protein FlhF n=1 Tax=Amphritea sp. HPY TaxID=3421652 RepID=UPI003D7EFCF0